MEEINEQKEPKLTNIRREILLLREEMDTLSQKVTKTQDADRKLQEK
jgi:hypothetical protein